MNKQEHVVNLVKAGIHSRTEIKELVGCTSAALASYFSGMRNAANFTGAEICPLEIEKEIDGEKKKVFTVTTFDEAERIKAERAANRTSAAAKTPAERKAAADKRVTKCEGTLDKARERHEGDPENEEIKLRFQKAEIELKLAEIELKRAAELVTGDDAAADDDESEAELDNTAEAPADEELM